MYQDFKSGEYWNQFYDKYHYDKESSFCRYIKTKICKNDFIIDLGCGYGQDAWSFYKDGYSITGVDRSSIAINKNQQKKLKLGINDGIDFNYIDLASKEMLSDFIINLKNKEKLYNRRIVVYARFLFHSVNKETEVALLQSLYCNLKIGDILAAEFRTIEDENRRKIYTDHFRRYIDSMEFVENLENNYKIIDYNKGTGFSMYKDENPYLARIIAEKI